MNYRESALEKLAALPSFFSVAKYPLRLFRSADGGTKVTQKVHKVQNGKVSPRASDYYTKLLSNPSFQERVGGKSEASYLAKVLSNTDVYFDRKDPSSQYNPLTGNISLGPYKSNINLDHENGHAFFENSPFYSSRIKDVMDKHGIRYSLGYYPLSDKPDDYENQPTEQAAELQSLRHALDLMPGKGRGPNGAYTPAEVQKALDSGRYDINGRRIFKGKPIEYITDLLNYARSKRHTPFRPHKTMVG